MAELADPNFDQDQDLPRIVTMLQRLISQNPSLRVMIKNGLKKKTQIENLVKRTDMPGRALLKDLIFDEENIARFGGN